MPDAKDWIGQWKRYNDPCGILRFNSAYPLPQTRNCVCGRLWFNTNLYKYFKPEIQYFMKLETNLLIQKIQTRRTRQTADFRFNFASGGSLSCLKCLHIHWLSRAATKTFGHTRFLQWCRSFLRHRGVHWVFRMNADFLPEPQGPY